MNPADIYRKSVYTTPLHTLLVQLHQQGGVFTKQAVDSIRSHDIVNARKYIQYSQDILLFLRSSLNMELEVSIKTAEVYDYYYHVLARWFFHPDTYSQEFDTFMNFWESWAETWAQVNVRLGS